MKNVSPTSAVAQLEPLPVLLTKARAAWAVGVCEGQVDKLVREGLFPPFLMLSHSRRWISAELLAWVDAGCPAMSDWQWPIIQDESKSFIDDRNEKAVSKD